MSNAPSSSSAMSTEVGTNAAEEGEFGDVQSQWVETDDGYRLMCRVSGQGRALLVLHGGPGSGSAYLEPLHRLARPNRRVITFDQLGCGDSDVPPVGYPWSMDNAVADVEAVRRAFGADDLDVLGHSWGGMLALQYAIDHPDRLRRLVLSNTVASTASMVSGFFRQVVDAVTRDVGVAALTADALGDHDDPAFGEAAVGWLTKWCTYGDEAAAALEAEEALNPTPSGLGLWGDRLWLTTGALRRWTAEERLIEIHSPTLVINGGADMSDMDANRILATRIPGAEWVTLQRSGHTAVGTAAEDVYLAIVDAFLCGWSR
jgi:proline iminopeptidase